MKDRSPTTGGISKPVRVDSGPGWYLYRADKYDFIALNFSWKLPEEFLMENLEGFQILIDSEKSSRRKIGYLYFCVSGNLTTITKDSLQFYYECYGKSGPAVIEPGDSFIVHITPYPRYQTPGDLKNYSLSIEIQAPTCHDKSLSNVEICQNSISVLKYFCNNRTFILHYSLSLWKGNRATVLLYHTINSNKFRNVRILESYYNMSLSMTAMPIKIRAEISLYEEFLVEVFNEAPDAQRLRTKISFAEACQSLKSVSPFQLGILVPACVIASVVLVTVMMCLLKPIIVFKRWSSDQPFTLKGVIAAKPTIADSRTDEKNHSPFIYIIFFDDHFKHRDIVSKFARFLQNDLGFIVIFEQWDEENLYSNYTSWLENAMALADKILVIWSPGAKKRWELQTSIETHQDDLYDLFTSTAMQIKKDLLRNQAERKYIFAYFEYCSESDIPEDFREISFSQFKLMGQFEKLYFLLKNGKNFQPGLKPKHEKVAFDQLFCPNVTEFGPILKTAITDMCKHVKSNPTWHCNGKSSFNSEKGNTCEYITSDESLRTAQTKARGATHFYDKVVVKNLHPAPSPKFKSRDHRTPQHPNCSWLNSNGFESGHENGQDFHSFSENNCRVSELKPRLESSFEIGHDFENTSNFDSAVRFSVHSFIDSIRADYFTEDNFKSNSETLNLEQKLNLEQ